MLKYSGGQKVKKGQYWSFASGDMVSVPKAGAVLPLGNNYIKLPLIAMLFLSPILGLLLVIFLPCIGFGLLFYHLGCGIGKSLHSAGTHLKATIIRNCKKLAKVL